MGSPELNFEEHKNCDEEREISKKNNKGIISRKRKQKDGREDFMNIPFLVCFIWLFALYFTSRCAFSKKARKIFMN